MEFTPNPHLFPGDPKKTMRKMAFYISHDDKGEFLTDQTEDTKKDLKLIKITKQGNTEHP